jgi:hypothetical protein
LADSGIWGIVDVEISDSPVYGDLDGDGQLEAAVSVGCDNGGGTADGQLGFAYVVVAARAGRLRVLGTVTPSIHRPGLHVSLFESIKIDVGRITAVEAWYRESDATCCPGGRATTVWTYSDGQLTPGLPDITQ